MSAHDVMDHSGPIELFLELVHHDWINIGHGYDGMCYPLCEMEHIKYPLLLIEKSSPCSGSSKFPLLLSEWSFTI